jgi:hypothetical protein
MEKNPFGDFCFGSENIKKKLMHIKEPKTAPKTKYGLVRVQSATPIQAFATQRERRISIRSAHVARISDGNLALTLANAAFPCWTSNCDNLARAVFGWTRFRCAWTNTLPFLVEVLRRSCPEA